VNWGKVFNFWTVNLLGWGLYSIINIPSFIISQRISFKYFLAAQASSLAGFLITAGFRYYFKKINILKYRFAKIAIIISVISIIAAGFWYVADSLTSFWIHGRNDVFKEKTFLLILYYIIWGATIFVSWSILYITIKLWRNWENEKLRVQEADKLATQAQLNALRYQLNPHFLFNSLSSLRAMVLKDPKIARDMISKLAEFLQYSLTDAERFEVSLSKEIENVKAYLDIEKIRFGDKLKIEFNIDQLAEDYPVPSFILNPLVENAVKYGYDTSDDELTIKINAEIDTDKSLVVSVENSGHWVEHNFSPTSKQKPLGLENIRKRLNFAYGENHSFEIQKNASFVKIIIRMRKEI